eukprot:3488340-Amphidinium_carterae.1
MVPIVAHSPLPHGPACQAATQRTYSPEQGRQSLNLAASRQVAGIDHTTIINDTDFHSVWVMLLALEAVECARNIHDFTQACPVP